VKNKWHFAFIAACAFLVPTIVSIVWWGDITISSGYGIVIARNLRNIGIAGFVGFIVLGVVLRFKPVKTTMWEVEPKSKAFGNCDEIEIVSGLMKYEKRIQGLEPQINKMIRYVRDVGTLKRQLLQLKEMACSINIKSNVDFIINELSDIDRDVYRMTVKTEASLDYYEQFADEEQYKITALKSINKQIADIEKLLSYYRETVNVLDKAVRDEQTADTGSIEEAGSIMSALKSFLEEERTGE
jgi:hypothetical protein